jgi:hypothetical protein
VGWGKRRVSRRVLVEMRHLNRRIGRRADYLDRRRPRLFGWQRCHANTASRRVEHRSCSCVIVGHETKSREHVVANNKDPNQKQPGEKEPGKYHYNPVNMSEKTIDAGKPESQQRANIDRIKSRGEQPHSGDD